MRSTMAVLLLAAMTLGPIRSPAHADDARPRRAEGGAHTQTQPAADSSTPEERMKRRFPQKVRVGDLRGLPLLDEDDRTLGHVTEVVRMPNGRIVLVSRCDDWFGHGGRLVGIPIETVAILARHLNVLDIPRKDFPSLPSWKEADGAAIADDDIIHVAISRR
ncbi:hypothetical protein CRT60_12870 [Azospirillum palustre]|uniref:PRC-barrel domain-containing protein n=2 Tax=Azospirillum palustre TaxID=2044885 RepID=A0A2B8BHH4_9PROT|nr:hypothetical protein CRT60_12870 [Azospirillum palustre]